MILHDRNLDGTQVVIGSTRFPTAHELPAYLHQIVRISDGRIFVEEDGLGERVFSSHGDTEIELEPINRLESPISAVAGHQLLQLEEHARPVYLPDAAAEAKLVNLGLEKLRESMDALGRGERQEAWRHANYACNSLLGSDVRPYVLLRLLADDAYRREELDREINDLLARGLNQDIGVLREQVERTIGGSPLGAELLQLCAKLERRPRAAEAPRSRSLIRRGRESFARARASLETFS